MDEKQKYIKIWEAAVAKAREAMEQGGIEAAEKYVQEMDDAFERYKEACNFEDSMIDSNFATINATLESALPKLMAKNKKALRECVKLIKEDKNLLAQFKFCNALRKFNCDTDAKDYINESLKLVSKDINYKTLKESNRKFAKLLHNIKPSNINENEMKFAKSCDYLLTHKKNLNNLTNFTNNLKSASDYLVENKKLNENKIDIISMAEQVEKKLNSLNEAEQALVKDIMMANSSGAETRRMNLFNKIKNECIESAILQNCLKLEQC